LPSPPVCTQAFNLVVWPYPCHSPGTAVSEITPLSTYVTTLSSASMPGQHGHSPTHFVIFWRFFCCFFKEHSLCT
jgi:hypothetical protein